MQTMLNRLSSARALPSSPSTRAFTSGLDRPQTGYESRAEATAFKAPASSLPTPPTFQRASAPTPPAKVPRSLGGGGGPCRDHVGPPSGALSFTPTWRGAASKRYSAGTPEPGLGAETSAVASTAAGGTSAAGAAIGAGETSPESSWWSTERSLVNAEAEDILDGKTDAPTGAGLASVDGTAEPAAASAAAFIEELRPWLAELRQELSREVREAQLALSEQNFRLHAELRREVEDLRSEVQVLRGELRVL